MKLVSVCVTDSGWEPDTQVCWYLSDPTSILIKKPRLTVIPKTQGLCIIYCGMCWEAQIIQSSHLPVKIAKNF